MIAIRSIPYPLLGIFLLGLLIAGCGKRGPVRPLAKPLPAAPSDISLQQLGEGFLLSWTLPRTNQDGSPLEDLEGFVLYKMSYDPAHDCPECRDTSLEWRRVDLEFLGAAHRIGSTLSLWDDDLEPETGYQYRVVPFTFRGQQGKSALVRRPFFAPPAAPTDLSAEALDQLVRLRWLPADPHSSPGERVGFRVYRRQTEEASPFQPIHSDFLQDPRYEDFGLKNNILYDYGVRSAVRIKGLFVESALSPVVTAMPQAGK